MHTYTYNNIYAYNAYIHKLLCNVIEVRGNSSLVRGKVMCSACNIFSGLFIIIIVITMTTGETIHRGAAKGGI